MIAGIFHQGSGLGNQLHRYIATRVRATDLGLDYTMTYMADDSGKEEGFKGTFFLDQPRISNLTGDWKVWHEKKVIEHGVDIRGYDPEFNFIQDNTIIDGEFQDERYWSHREREVNEWLDTDPLEVDEDTCVIGFRGGEFTVFPELFLPNEYWEQGIKKMRKLVPWMKFEVHTDDPITAKQMFPEFKVIHDVGINWRSTRYAQYAIIANSSFYILPRWLRQGEGGESSFEGGVSWHPTDTDAVTIAPRYWARHNTGVWALSQNYYSRFKYI